MKFLTDCENIWISRKDIIDWINTELNYSKIQKSERNKGYFDGLEKVKQKLLGLNEIR